MGRTGGYISDVTARAKDAVDPAMRQIAKDAAQALVRRIKENTPVGEPQPPLRGSTRDHQPGNLRESIEEKPLVKRGDYWETGAQTDVIYAPYVEEGTGLWGPSHRRYRIEPKDPDGVLAFYVRNLSPEGRATVTGSYNPGEGVLVFRKYVMHPGSPGQHMFAIGAAKVEAEMDQIAQAGLQEWKRRTEGRR